MRISDWSSDVCSSDLTLGSIWRENVASHGVPRQAEWHEASPFMFREKGREASGMGSIGFRALADPRLELVRAQDVVVFERLVDQGVGGQFVDRSEERRVGKGCVSTGSARWRPA